MAKGKDAAQDSVSSTNFVKKLYKMLEGQTFQSCSYELELNLSKGRNVRYLG